MSRRTDRETADLGGVVWCIGDPDNLQSMTSSDPLADQAPRKFNAARMLHDLNGGQLSWRSRLSQECLLRNIEPTTKEPEDFPMDSWAREHSARATEALMSYVSESGGFPDINQTARTYTRTLRAYVDLWLATGRTGEGVETAADRQLTGEIKEVVERVFRHDHTVLIATGNGYIASVMPPGNIETTGGERAAGEMLAAMLFDGWRLKIAKCVQCEMYFLLQHPKRPYKNGTVCARADCQSKQKNKRATNYMRDGRQAAKKELYKLAAKKFGKRILAEPNWHTRRRMKNAIVDYLRREIDSTPSLKRCYPSGVAVNWLALSEHQVAIERIARELAEATHAL